MPSSTLTIDYTSGTTVWFNSGATFAAGSYTLTYIYGAIYLGGGTFGVNRTVNPLFTIYATYVAIDSDASFQIAPGSDTSYASQAATEAAEAGASISFTLTSPSRIGLRLQEFSYPDTIDTRAPTYRLDYDIIPGGGGPGARSPYSDLIVADGAFGYWRRDEGGGSVSFDYTGRGLNGTYNGNVHYGVAGAISGDPDLAAAHGAIGDSAAPGYTDLPPSLFGGANYTFEAWLKYDGAANTGARLFSIVDVNSTAEQYFTPSAAGSGNGEFVSSSIAGGVKTIAYPSALRGGAWYHVVCTLALGPAADSHLYVNGALVGTVTGMQTDSDTAAISIGRALLGAAPNLNAVIDEVAWYLGELSADQVLAHWRAGTSGAGLALWRSVAAGAAAPKAFGSTAGGRCSAFNAFAAAAAGAGKIGYVAWRGGSAGAARRLRGCDTIAAGGHGVLNSFAAQGGGAARVGYAAFAAGTRGASSVLNSFAAIAAGADGVGFVHCAGGTRGAAIVLQGYAAQIAGACRMMLNCAITAAGQDRVANDALARYELYRGVDGAPDLDGSPFQTSTALPMTTAALDPGHSYSFILRQRNAWGLSSLNIDAWTVDLSDAGIANATPPSPPADAAAAAGAAGTVIITARYLYAADGVNQADKFLIYLTTDGSTPDPATATPVIVTMRKSDGTAKLNYRTIAYAEGTLVKAIVRTRRSGVAPAPDVDSINSNVVSATATLLGPDAPANPEIFIGDVAEQAQEA